MLSDPRGPDIGACTAWDPYITSIDWRWSQHRYAHFVTGDYHHTSSVSAMLTQLQWPTLQERRAQFKMVMMYRIVHVRVDTLQSHLIPNKMSIRGHHQQFRVPFARALVYQILDLLRGRHQNVEHASC